MKTRSSINSRQNNGNSVLMSMLVVAVFFSMAARAIFSPLMPMLQKEMGVTLSLAGTFFLLLSISYAVAMLFCGFLAARIGHGKTIVAALAMIAFGLLLSALAPGIPLLAVGLFLIGAGAGTYPPSGIVMINTKISIQKKEHRLCLP